MRASPSLCFLLSSSHSRPATVANAVLTTSWQHLLLGSRAGPPDAPLRRADTHTGDLVRRALVCAREAVHVHTRAAAIADACRPPRCVRRGPREFPGSELRGSREGCCRRCAENPRSRGQGWAQRLRRGQQAQGGACARPGCVGCEGPSGESVAMRRRPGGCWDGRILCQGCVNKRMCTSMSAVECMYDCPLCPGCFLLVGTGCVEELNADASCG